MTIYEIEEFMAANELLLLVGILMSLFAAWVIAEKVIREELGEQSQFY